MDNILEHNVQTGEIVTRELTNIEIEQREIDAEQAILNKQKEMETEIKRSKALEKLMALGLDLDDLRLLGI